MSATGQAAGGPGPVVLASWSPDESGATFRDQAESVMWFAQQAQANPGARVAWLAIPGQHDRPHVALVVAGGTDEAAAAEIEAEYAEAAGGEEAEG